jgi:AcrR family transcriptional regulator
MAHTVVSTDSRDGRTERSERTRDAVVNAMLDLIEEGDLRPTAPRIADRAGVSLRTVFHHFEDLEELFSVVARRQMERHLTDLPRVPRDGSLATRIGALAAGRAQLHESIAPVRRAALLFEPFSQSVARHLAWARSRGRLEIEQVFAPELGLHTGPARRDLAEALTAVASWSTWESLRGHQGLSVTQARRVMIRALRALLSEE